MSKNIKIAMNPHLEDDVLDAIADSIKDMEIDIECPNCHESIHLSFSDDSCKFCGFVINYGIDLQV